MESFLKTILIILLVYFSLKFLGKLLLPYLMRYIAKKAGQKMENAFKGFEGFQQSGKPDEPKKESVPKKSSEVVGEYIDYEEIE